MRVCITFNQAGLSMWIDSELAADVTDQALLQLNQPMANDGQIPAM